MNIDEVIATIVQLTKEREQIYEDSHVTAAEHPRLTEIEAELLRLWDLRRRIEAAHSAGLSTVPVPADRDPSEQVG